MKRVANKILPRCDLTAYDVGFLAYLPSCQGHPSVYYPDGARGEQAYAKRCADSQSAEHALLAVRGDDGMHVTLAPTFLASFRPSYRAQNGCNEPSAFRDEDHLIFHPLLPFPQPNA